MEDTTHVHALKQLLAESNDQIVEYFPGVGTNEPREEGGSFVGRGLNKVLGGATGFGLGKKVKEAYQFIARNYKDGDEIYLFGFSRGAYTARSVAGMIRKCGIVQNPTNRAVRKAFRLYRRGGVDNHPDRFHIREARAKMSPDFATSTKDQETRKGGKVPLVNIAYVGVWDTVGQRGIPEQLLGVFAKVWNQFYAFHDTDLSSLVRAARHAVAVDERRVFYQPALWGNLDRLNSEVGGTKYEQLWFVGDHGIVGGSAKQDNVSCYTLKWVAEAAGLTLKPGKTLDHPEADIGTDLPRLDDPSGIYKVARNLMKWRNGVGGEDDVHGSVKERATARADYRPGSLGAVLAKWF
jgi:uncharacterized protein (DUF2235 family)